MIAIFSFSFFQTFLIEVRKMQVLLIRFLLFHWLCNSANLIQITNQTWVSSTTLSTMATTPTLSSTRILSLAYPAATSANSPTTRQE
jgi:hypothetical protein